MFCSAVPGTDEGVQVFDIVVNVKYLIASWSVDEVELTTMVCLHFGSDLAMQVGVVEEPLTPGRGDSSRLSCSKSCAVLAARRTCVGC